MTQRRLHDSSGLTLIELIVTVTIISVLSMLVMPMAQMTAKRAKEVELRRNLRIIRTAIDEYKKSYDRAVEEKKIVQGLDQVVSGYPPTLKELVEGKDFGGLYKNKKKFLRAIPADPFNPPKHGEEPEWSLRSYTDEPDSTSWGGEDVYDIHSLSTVTAIDGTHYNEW
jgi:general secretion pathway protein G